MKNTGRLASIFLCLSALGLVLGRPALPQSTPASTYQFSTASQDGIGKSYFHREIARVMGFEGATWLERPDREQEERPDLLLKALQLTPGMTVADIGAGSGYLSKRMASEVAPGKVMAVDVQPEMVDLLRKLSAEPGFSNIVPVQGRADSVQLAEGSVDLAIMVDVYHELSDPYAVVRSILTALKPHGRLVFVEYRGEDARVPILTLHKMTFAQLLLEMQPFPLSLDRRDEHLPIQHIVIFRKN